MCTNGQGLPDFVIPFWLWTLFSIASLTLPPRFSSYTAANYRRRFVNKGQGSPEGGEPASPSGSGVSPRANANMGLRNLTSPGQKVAGAIPDLRPSLDSERTTLITGYF